MRIPRMNGRFSLIGPDRTRQTRSELVTWTTRFVRRTFEHAQHDDIECVRLVRVRTNRRLPSRQRQLGTRMSTVRDHRDLLAWQKAIDLGLACYSVSRSFPREERYGLTKQLRDSAVSVAANIAEGNGRLTTGEYLNHLSVARGSLREVDTHLEFALRLVYAPKPAIIAVRSVLDADAALLTRLIMRVKERGNRR